MARLITVAANNVLGQFEGPRPVDILGALSPLPPHELYVECRRLLYCQPRLDADVVARICGALLIEPRDFPTPWPVAAFALYPRTLVVLRELRKIAPVVVLSNVTVMNEPSVKGLVERCAPYVGQVYTSCGTGILKPDHLLWQRVASDHGVAPGDVVHIGSQWFGDVVGSTRAGCRAVYANTTYSEAPNVRQWRGVARDRVAVTSRVPGVLNPVGVWHYIDELEYAVRRWEAAVDHDGSAWTITTAAQGAGPQRTVHKRPARKGAVVVGG